MARNRLRPPRKYRSKPRPPQTQQAFPFLTLPAELRNRIYLYALTAPDGIKVRWRRSNSRWKKKPVMFTNSDKEEEVCPINQLQYVNRQLHKETAGLELQYNRVIFDGYPGSNGDTMKSLYVFAGRCTPTKLQWLTHATLAQQSDLTTSIQSRCAIPWVKRHIDKIIGLLNFCIENKHIHVEFRLPYFVLYPDPLPTLSVNGFIETGILLSRLFRGADISHIDIPGNTAARYAELLSRLVGDDVKDTIKRLAGEATNLRLYPNDKHFDIKRFEKEVEEKLSDPWWADFVANGGGLKWVEYARQWSAYGL
ncbi:uncharacterized protein K460DRAFT_410938 [Cucurbitaria berberidis CBS 394.84]|uniref:F-box domain-containing protein n=1 Tax=Cucurbitaria berberidis CBS 394.84 TaxID=1168544 RepID=A0A9P4G799_9PLEO|nr:uncharacterized protein K460DRAFT_410938 [Cucurbitaria berberidis CBS 394.84]KAF1840347.1 hypothetical protein K460DRAFT_410938 [Cucurbitaria berberidis CBS 394.84]